MKKVRFCLGMIVVIVCGIIGGTMYFFGIALDTKVTITDEEDAYDYISTKRDYLKLWVDSLREHDALRDTFIKASDGSKIRAIFAKAPQPSPGTALIIHGYTDNAIRMLMIGHLYHQEMGYNIFLPDLRGHGKSDNDYIQMGWDDRKDIIDWLPVVNRVYGDTTQIVLHGISMGAAAIMMAAGEQLPHNVKCFVEDCGYTSVWDQFHSEMKQSYNLPAFPFLYTTSLYCKWKEGWDFKEASSLEKIKKCHLPMLFIHGDADTYVPTWMVYSLYQAKPGEKELWVVPGVNHANAYWDCTGEYVQRTKTFVGRYIH